MSDEVTVGVVGKPHGVAGEVYVHPDPDIGCEFAPGLRLGTADGRVLTVADTRVHARRRLVRFAGVGDRDAAEALRGTELTLPRADVELDEDAYWAAELIGREVQDPDGEILGVVERVADGLAHDYLVLARPDGGEVLVPAVAELVEITAQAVILRPVPGLLDEGEQE